MIRHNIEIIVCYLDILDIRRNIFSSYPIESYEVSSRTIITSLKYFPQLIKITFMSTAVRLSKYLHRPILVRLPRSPWINCPSFINSEQKFVMREKKIGSTSCQFTRKNKLNLLVCFMQDRSSRVMAQGIQVITTSQGIDTHLLFPGIFTKFCSRLMESVLRNSKITLKNILPTTA